MRILFYIEPMIELENPLLFLPWWDFSYDLIKTLKEDDSTEYDFRIITNTVIGHRIWENWDHSPNCIISLTQEELLEKFNQDYLEASIAWYKKTYTEKQLLYSSDLIQDKLGSFTPDIVITYTPVPFIRKAFPDAVILHRELGLVSRPPFPESHYLDPNGMFKDASLIKHHNAIESFPISETDKNSLERYRKYFTGLIDSKSPFDEEINQASVKFDFLLLVPLQFSRFYAFDGNCDFTSQFHFLSYVLSQIPGNIGVIFTAHPEYPIFTDDLISYLESAYENFLYFPKFEKFKSTSQYLFRHVDGVISVSSSVGLQSLIWKKKLFVIGDSHLRFVADAEGLSNVEEILMSPPVDRDSILWWLLTRYYFPNRYLYNTNWLAKYLKRIADLHKGIIEFETIFMPIDDPEKLINGLIEDAILDIPIRNIEQYAKFHDVPYEFSDGFFQDEGGWRWMNKKGVIDISADILPAEVCFEVSCGNPDYYDKFPFDVGIYVDNNMFRAITFEIGKQTHEVKVEIGDKTSNSQIRLESDGTFIPRQCNNVRDNRQLSIRLSNLEIHSTKAIIGEQITHNSLQLGRSGLFDDLVHLTHQAEQQVENGNLKGAWEFLTQAHNLMPDNPEIIISRGNLAVLMGDIETARREFVKATVLYPDLIQGHLNLAALYLDSGQAVEAEASLNNVLSLEPDNIEALKALASLALTQENFGEALPFLAKVYQQSPEDINTLLALGSCFWKLGELESARVIYERVVQIAPDNQVANQNLEFILGQMATTGSMDAKNDQKYSSRIDKEIEYYKKIENVHDLPEIYHYWSNKYLLPLFRNFGFDNVKEFYILYMSKVCNASKDSIYQFISIGAGNCDLEVEIVETLINNGIANFVYECVDINEYMLERGQVLATEKNVAHKMKFLNTDVNTWNPLSQYHIVIVNQALHHFLELEQIFDKIYEILHLDGYFLTSDMIGRNGHMRWPEALMVVNRLWDRLPSKYKYNHQLKRLELEFDNWDCAQEGFEGIRAQDILPLLLKSNFHFDLFLGFGNAIDIFIDRSFGHNFDPDNDGDKSFIDKVSALDQDLIEKGILTPTHMIAALTKKSSSKSKFYKHLTHDFCFRWPDEEIDDQFTIDNIGARLDSICFDPFTPPKMPFHDPVLYGNGFYDDEGGYRWLNANGIIQIRSSATPAEVSFEFTCGNVEYYDNFPFEMRVYMNQELARTVIFESSEQTITVEFAIQKTLSDVTVRIQSSECFVPSQCGLGDDIRQLSVRLDNLQIQSTGEISEELETNNPTALTKVIIQFDRELDWSLIESYEEYQQHVSNMQSEYNERMKYENNLIVDQSFFTVGGYCQVCKQKTNFMVYFMPSNENNGNKIPNWRESLICEHCGLNNRIRASAHIFEKMFHPYDDSVIFLTEQESPLYNWFNRNYSNVIGSEFLGDNLPLGQNNQDGIRNEDLTELTFLHNHVDFILTFDVLEHVPDYQKALQECFRVLKPDGCLIFTIPFDWNSKENLIRAVVKENGEFDYLLPPEYHFNPLNDEDCLVFTIFGWELLDQIREIGFQEVGAYLYWSMDYGYLGREQICFIAKKSKN